MPSRPRVSHQTSESADGPVDIKVPQTWALGRSRVAASARLLLTFLISERRRACRGIRAHNDVDFNRMGCHTVAG